MLQKLFWGLYGFHISLVVHIRAESLVQLAHCITKIQLLLCETYIIKMVKFVRVTVIRADNSFPFTSYMYVLVRR